MVQKDVKLTNKDSGKFAEIIGSRILWNFKQSKILDEIFPDIKILSARRIFGLVGDFAYKISYKKDDGYGQRIVIFEVKHGIINIGRFQFEKYCKIISQPENYFPNAEEVRIIFLMFTQIDTLGMNSSFSYKELDKELAIKFLEKFPKNESKENAEEDVKTNIIVQEWKNIFDISKITEK
jgi:hypothetical protein